MLLHLSPQAHGYFRPLWSFDAALDLWSTALGPEIPMIPWDRGAICLISSHFRGYHSLKNVANCNRCGNPEIN